MADPLDDQAAAARREHRHFAEEVATNMTLAAFVMGGDAHSVDAEGDELRGWVAMLEGAARDVPRCVHLHQARGPIPMVFQLPAAVTCLRCAPLVEVPAEVAAVCAVCRQALSVKALQLSADGPGAAVTFIARVCDRCAPEPPEAA